LCDGSVLPILHSNGCEIANPCFLARIPQDELRKSSEGYGYWPVFVKGHELTEMYKQMAQTLDDAVGEIAQIWAEARGKGSTAVPHGQ
jgi:xylulose-5-phosphate/fructose-6-phosphate phosphoketolase